MDPVTCPSCSRTMRFSAVIIGDGPEPAKGNLTICVYCLAVMVFTGRGTEVRRQTEAEEIQGLFDRRIHEARAAVAAFRLP